MSMIKKAILILLFAVPVFSQQIIGRKPLLGEQINWSPSPAEGLVGIWLFNEGSGNKIFDLPMNGNDGTLTNMDEADWVPGRNGWALDFDGSDDHIIIADDPVLDLTTGFTISLWVKLSSTANQVLIVNGDFNFNGSAWEYGIIILANDLYCYADANFNFNCGSASAYVGNWQHIVYILDANGNGNCYVNGDEKGSGSGLDMPDVSARDLYVAAAGSGSYSDSEISDIRIYNRVLTERERWSLYVNSYAIFEQPLYGRMLAAAAAAAAVERMRLIKPND